MFILFTKKPNHQSPHPEVKFNRSLVLFLILFYFFYFSLADVNVAVYDFVMSNSDNFVESLCFFRSEPFRKAEIGKPFFSSGTLVLLL